MKRLVIIWLAGLLVCFLATATAGAQLTGFIDVANDGNNNTAIAYPTGTLTVSGWAADLNPVVAPVDSVQIFIDGNFVGIANLNQPRQDVATYYNNQALLPSGWTFSVAIKNLNLSLSQHTVSAVASDPYYANVGLSPSSTSCCVITVAEADLTESVPSVTGTIAAGGSIQIQEVTSNQASVAAGISWTRMYLNTSNAKGGTLLATRSISSLGAGGSSPGKSNATLPQNIGGTNYYIIACANDTGSVIESNYANDCNGVQVTVQGADLAVPVATFPNIAAVGATIQATETTSNLGAGSTSTTWTRFYLNKTTDSKSGGTLVGTQVVPGLTPANPSYVGFTNIGVPSNAAPGTYYLVACANDTNSTFETNYANNCTKPSQQLTVVSATGAAIVDANKGTDASITCSTAVPCKTITHALAITPPRPVVIANPGVYSEQVVITRSVTLTSSSPYGAIIQPPPTPLNQDPTDSATSLVWVGTPASSVAISNITVQGAGPGNCNLIYGVFVTSGTATVTGNKVLTIGDASCTMGGVAIRFGNADLGYTAAGLISNNVVSGYLIRGIVVDASVANVSGNTVTGPSGIPLISPSGIVVKSGARSLVSGNTVSQNKFGTLCPAHADGIVLAALSGGVSVTNNTVTANDEGIGIYSLTPSSTNASIMSNTVFNNAFLGIHIDANSGGNTVELNTIYGNSEYDEVDETGSWSSPNNWGTDPSNYNILGNGGPYTQFLGSLGCTWGY